MGSAKVITLTAAAIMKLLLSCLSFLALITLGLGIKCYVCNSHKNIRCKSESLNDFLEECEYREGFTPFCRKQDIWLEQSYKDGSRVIRDCGYQRREDKDCYQKR